MQQRSPEEQPTALKLVRLDAGVAMQESAASHPVLAALDRRRSLMFFVGLPTVLAAVYFLFVAASRYEAEAEFVVRTPSNSSAAQLSTLLQSANIGRSADDAYIVHAFLKSRDAVDVLVKEAGLLDILKRTGIDVLSRYPLPFSAPSNERLYKSAQGLIDVEYETTTGISSLKVQAYRPEDARLMADVLLRSAESLINRLGNRAQTDSIASAERDVDQSRNEAVLAMERMTEFRNREALIDPVRTSTTTLDTISKLSLNVALLNSQQLEMEAISPTNPQMASTRLKIDSLKQQIELERLKLAGAKSSLAPLIAEYERLLLEREFGERKFGSALVTLEAARLDAQKQRLYLDRITNPVAPDRPKYPYRFLNIFFVFALSFMIYWSARWLITDTLQHAEK